MPSWRMTWALIEARCAADGRSALTVGLPLEPKLDADVARFTALAWLQLFSHSLYKSMLSFVSMEVFEAVAQPKRREILRLLAGRELGATEIASHFDVTQPAISQHLK